MTHRPPIKISPEARTTCDRCWALKSTVTGVGVFKRSRQTSPLQPGISILFGNGEFPPKRIESRAKAWNAMRNPTMLNRLKIRDTYISQMVSFGQESRRARWITELRFDWTFLILYSLLNVTNDLIDSRLLIDSENSSLLVHTQKYSLIAIVWKFNGSILLPLTDTSYLAWRLNDSWWITLFNLLFSIIARNHIVYHLNDCWLTDLAGKQDFHYYISTPEFVCMRVCLCVAYRCYLMQFAPI